MDRADQPSEWNDGHDELDRFERFVRRRPVIEHQQNAGRDLYEKEKQRHSAEVVEDAVSMKRDGLVRSELDQLRNAETLVEPLSGSLTFSRITGSAPNRMTLNPFSIRARSVTSPAST